ncbi:MAG: GNAT family N-acetyltransferase [Candidatus Izemoplasmatales bacterium]|uniref:GNAT family N-acetyltransferase n=1 Tax=Hujiaoplasma nucleasis TaxID=2725268 RepID=A0A7L6N529_9MOLU|nr:GNAT family N-acetyltransferase [Hujiaoplasma nucleasis]QLY39679.1 GNAT family N-acetyltransferase [Hujiaoplasma nucleasis]
MIRLANQEDLVVIKELAALVRENMQNSGLQQWLGNYPDIDIFQSDFQKSGLYVYLIDNQIIASISILPENDPPYKEIQWIKDKSLVIHRLLVHPYYQKQGIGKAMFEKAIEETKKGYQSLKVDTHPDNHKMQNLILKMNFKYMGYLSSINRLAYELIV